MKATFGTSRPKKSFFVELLIMLSGTILGRQTNNKEENLKNKA
jgi:hypothetical protein